MEKAAIVYNPKATGFNKEILKKAIINFESQGIKVKTYASKYKGHVIDLIKKIKNENDLLISLGGDGTLGEAFQGLNDSKKTPYYIHIPTGTANDTADNFGLIKGNPDSSIDLYANLNNCQSIDVDMVAANNKPFGYVSCCGTFTNLTYETPASLKKSFGKLGYYMFSALTGFTALPELINKPLKLTYQKNGQEIKTEALTMIISNSKTFAGLNIFQNAEVNDGKFEVTILKDAPNNIPSFIIDLFQNKDFNVEDYSEYIDHFTTDNFKVKFENSIPNKGFNNDGDNAEFEINDNTLEYKVLKKVKMLTPRKY